MIVTQVRNKYRATGGKATQGAKEGTRKEHGTTGGEEEHGTKAEARTEQRTDNGMYSKAKEAENDNTATAVRHPPALYSSIYLHLIIDTGTCRGEHARILERYVLQNLLASRI